MKTKLPPWFKQEIPGRQAQELMRLCSESGVHTVCIEAGCPNVSSCFANKQLAFMILGDTCSRSCGFCMVKKTGRSTLSIDKDEPDRVAGLVKALGLDYVVITSVCRDDLCDGGARVFARTIKAVRGINKDKKVEVLIPDFQGDINSLECVLDARPDCLAHNLETVPRLYPQLRPQADYRRSLEVLKKIGRAHV